MLDGIAASIGSIGDAYDNALAETTIGLFKTEAVGRRSPFLAGPLRTIDDVEYITSAWVHKYNTPPTAQPAQLHPTRRIRDRLLRSNPGVPAGDASTTKPASNPERFNERISSLVCVDAHLVNRHMSRQLARLIWG